MNLDDKHLLSILKCSTEALLLGTCNTPICTCIHRVSQIRTFFLVQNFYYPPSERNETGGYTVFTFVCLSVCAVCTLSINIYCVLNDGRHDVIAARRAAVNPFCVI